MNNFYHSLIFALLAPILLLGACNKDDDTKPEEKILVGDPSFQIIKQSNGYALPSDPDEPHQIDAGTIITFLNTSTGDLRTTLANWVITWTDSDGENQQRVVQSYGGKAFMRFIDFDTATPYTINMVIDNRSVSYPNIIEVLEADLNDGGDQPGGDTGGVDTVTDTFLADAGWDTSFENESLGFWKNFNWTDALSMCNIESSNMMAHTGSFSTYFEIEANGGMAGGFRDPTGVQFTIPIVAGDTYEVGFWIFITAKPAAANLVVVFGGNKSGYIPVDLSEAEVGKWCYTMTKVTATDSDTNDLILFCDHAKVDEPFKFYIDDIAMDTYTEE